MAKAAVAELVGDDRQHLRLARFLDERVEEHHPSRRTEPGDVRVQLRRPPAGISHEYLANGDARTICKAEHGIAEPGVLERAEAVEDGLEHEGRDEAEEEDEERGAEPGNERPGGRKDPRAEDETRKRQPGQDAADRHDLHAIEREFGRRLP